MGLPREWVYVCLRVSLFLIIDWCVRGESLFRFSRDPVAYGDERIERCSVILLIMCLK